MNIEIGNGLMNADNVRCKDSDASADTIINRRITDVWQMIVAVCKMRDIIIMCGMIIVTDATGSITTQAVTVLRCFDVR